MYPIPNQVKKTIPTDFVKNPAAEYPRLITFPLCNVIQIPTTRCIKLRKIGARTPRTKYNIIRSIFVYYIISFSRYYLHSKSQVTLYPKQEPGGRPGKADEAITWPQGGKSVCSLSFKKPFFLF